MTTTTPTTAGQLTGAAAAGHRSTGRRVPFAVLVAASMLGGLVTTLLLVLVVFAGATEPVITGAGLVGLGSGWALLAMLTTRWTSQPQRWAAVPAAVMAATGIALLISRPATTCSPPPAGCGHRLRSSWPSGWSAPHAAPRPDAPAGCCTRSSAW